MIAPWLQYSRWRPKPAEACWIVVNKDREPAPEPCLFTEYGDALKRSDALNQEEQAALLLLL